MSQILNFLKKIQSSLVGFNNTILHHHARHEDSGSDEINVAGLSGELADPQPPKSHSLASHSTKAHSELTGVSSGQHHAKTGNNEVYGLILCDTIGNRPVASISGRFFWATDEHILYRDNGTTWNKAAAADHADLDGVTSGQHHSQSHSLASHSTKAHSELTGVSSDQHHPQSHSLASHSTKAHSELTGVSSGQHHTPGIVFNLGLATVGTKQGQALIPGTLTISKVKIYADTAPTGASIKVDIHKNGTTIFTTQANRPTISAGGHADDSGTPNITSLTEGDRLRVDVDQVGSSTPGGNDLLVTILC